MGDTLVDLLPYIVGTAVVPAWVILVLFLLRGEHGLSKALALVSWAVSVRIAQGIVFGFIFNGASQGADVDGKSGVIAIGLSARARSYQGGWTVLLMDARPRARCANHSRPHDGCRLVHEWSEGDPCVNCCQGPA